MTDKEKAKAYNEALKRAKKYNIDDAHAYQGTLIKLIFPELRENEDERVRKALLKMAKVPRKEIYEHEGITKEQAISYLEKQKYDRMKPVYDNQDSFESALEKAWKEYNDSGSRTVDGCEDDYVECAHAKGFIEGYLFGLERQKEQNHEEPKIAFGDWGDKEKQEAIFTCLKYMRFIKKITNQEYDDLTKWLNDNLVSNVLEKDGWTDSGLVLDIPELVEKINEIIRYINEKEEENESSNTQNRENRRSTGC